MVQKSLALVPGLALTFAIAVVASLAAGFLPAAVNAVIVAVLMGLFIRNWVNLPAQFQPGIKFSLQKLLRFAIILLGIRLSFLEVVRIGAQSVAIIVTLMTAAILLVYLGGKYLKLPRRLALLIGVGTAICGNSAIVAVAPVIDAKEEEVSFSVATITLFGMLAVFLYPLIGLALGMSDSFFGTWAGTAVNDTSQVVATGFAYSQGAGEVATVVKLTRNALLGPVIVLIGILWDRGVPEKGMATDPTCTTWVCRELRRLGRLGTGAHLFVLGFLVMAVLNTLGVFPKPVVTQVNAVSSFLILMALAGVGLGTNLGQMRKTGLKPFYLGLFGAALLAMLSLGLIYLAGIR